jgi:hypothetical protein
MVRDEMQVTRLVAPASSVKHLAKSRYPLRVLLSTAIGLCRGPALMVVLAYHLSLRTVVVISYFHIPVHQSAWPFEAYIRSVVSNRTMGVG